MKNYFIKIFIVIFFFFLTSNSYANKIVYIDMDYILNNSIKGKNISNILENENKLIIDKFLKTEQILKTEEQQIISKKNILNDNDFKKLIQDFKAKIDNFNFEKKNSIKLLNNKKINLTKEFIVEINPIFVEFAKKNSISIILKKKDIIMGDSNLDKTLEFLNLVNEKINDK